MASGAYIEDCLRRKLIFFTGKGGVGKTTLAWSVALACARRGKRVTVASWSPTGTQSAPILGDWGVEWLALDTLGAFREYVVRLLYFERVFDAVFDNHIFRTFVLATPGLSDTVIAGKIWDCCDRGEQDLLIVDLPSTGHALSFLRSPLGVREAFSVGMVRRETDKIRELFASPATRFDLVATSQELPMTEASELHHAIEALYPARVGYWMLNRQLPEFPVPALPPTAPEQRALLERYTADRSEQRRVLETSEWDRTRAVFLPYLSTRSFGDGVEQLARQLEER